MIDERTADLNRRPGIPGSFTCRPAAAAAIRMRPEPLLERRLE